MVSKSSYNSDLTVSISNWGDPSCGTVQSVVVLLCKQKELSLIPRNHMEKRQVWWVILVILELREVGTGGSLGLDD